MATTLNLVGSALAIGNGAPSLTTIDWRPAGNLYSTAQNLYYLKEEVLAGTPMVIQVPNRNLQITVIAEANAAGDIDIYTTLDDCSTGAGAENATWYSQNSGTLGAVISSTFTSPLGGIKIEAVTDTGMVWIAMQPV